MHDKLQIMQKIVESLAVLTFYMSGQTPRVSEYYDHKFANSQQPRTVFWHAGGLYFVTRRLKTSNMTMKEAFVPIKCPPVLTELWKKYFLLVKPAEIDLVYAMHGEEAAGLHKEFLLGFRV